MGLDIQSKEVIDKISEELKVQPAMSIPRELMDKIQLVYGVNPDRLVRMIGGSLVDGTTTTLHTTHATKRTFLLSCFMTVAKDVVSDSIFSTIAVVPFGSGGVNALRIRYQPVTAGQFTEGINYSLPIELEKGTDIDFLHNAGTASIDGSALITFFETDPQ